jgi:hypothetical protein
MWAKVVSFMKTCNICQKMKTDMKGAKGKLLPHSIPLLPYNVVIMDLITGLPKSEGHDAILMIMDKLMKYIHYLPTNTDLSQEGFTKLFMDEIVYSKGIPQKMIMDRDTRWSMSFWEAIAKHLGLDLMLSTSHHPQTDGQMEKANATLEIALRAYMAGNH